MKRAAARAGSSRVLIYAPHQYSTPRQQACSALRELVGRTENVVAKCTSFAAFTRQAQRTLASVIADLCNGRGVSPRALSERIGLDDDFIWKITSRQYHIRAVDLTLIAYGLGMTFTEFAARVEKRL